MCPCTRVYSHRETRLRSHMPRHTRAHAHTPHIWHLPHLCRGGIRPRDSHRPRPGHIPECGSGITPSRPRLAPRVNRQFDDTSPLLHRAAPIRQALPAARVGHVNNKATAVPSTRRLCVPATNENLPRIVINLPFLTNPKEDGGEGERGRERAGVPC